jgi:hypothetical protein
MSMNPWIIDIDFMAEPGTPAPSNANAVHVAGPRDYKGNGRELTKTFRMYDDDGNLYYEGRSMEEGFEPLDDFGMPNAGCTRIDYKNDKGEYETI